MDSILPPANPFTRGAFGFRKRLSRRPYRKAVFFLNRKPVYSAGARRRDRSPPPPATTTTPSHRGQLASLLVLILGDLGVGSQRRMFPKYKKHPRANAPIGPTRAACGTASAGYISDMYGFRRARLAPFIPDIRRIRLQTARIYRPKSCRRQSPAGAPETQNALGSPGGLGQGRPENDDARAR